MMYDVELSYKKDMYEWVSIEAGSAEEAEKRGYEFILNNVDDVSAITVEDVRESAPRG